MDEKFKVDDKTRIRAGDRVRQTIKGELVEGEVVAIRPKVAGLDYRSLNVEDIEAVVKWEGNLETTEEFADLELVERTIYDLALHEVMTVSDKGCSPREWRVMRVADGWIYQDQAHGHPTHVNYVS